jgi:predicted transcriptional regulator
MSDEWGPTTSRTRLAVILSAFLLISSGLMPAVATSDQSFNPHGLFFFLSILDPFITVSVTRVAPNSGGQQVSATPGNDQSMPGSFEATASPSGGVVSSLQQAPSSVVSSNSQSTSFTSGSMDVYTSSSAIVSMVAIVPGIWDESSKKRSRPHIYVEILELLKRGPMTPFEIAFYVRLNHKRTKEYVRLLERNGYLESIEEDGRTLYAVSGNGRILIERLRSILKENDTQTTTAPTRENGNW